MTLVSQATPLAECGFARLALRLLQYIKPIPLSDVLTYKKQLPGSPQWRTHNEKTTDRQFLKRRAGDGVC